jgi:hypothetical protein
MIKKGCYWFEDGIIVQSFSMPVKNNWIKSWTEKNGQVKSITYFHKLHGGTFIYPINTHGTIH